MRRLLGRPAVAAAWRTFLLTRLAVAGVAIFAVLSLTPATEFGEPELGRTHPFSGWALGGSLDLLFSPLARWDAGWYLRIADDGYGTEGSAGAGSQSAFFPLYPLLVRITGAAFGSSEGALLIAAYGVSLLAFLAALYLFYRLVELEVGQRYAASATMLLAVFPGALYFSAPYSESLFLLASVGAFYAARTGRWVWAGALAGAASATRPVGIVLLLPLALMYLYGPRADAAPTNVAAGLRPRYRPRPNILWLALAPLGVVGYSAYLAAEYGDGLAWVHPEPDLWGRELAVAGPIGGLWDSVVAGVDGVGELADRLAGHLPAGAQYDFALAFAIHNVVQLGFLAFALIATVGAFRRLPLPYAAYAAAAIALPLSARVPEHPLDSFHRYVAVIFPLFIWLAVVCQERGWTERAVAVSAIVLGAFTATFATSHWLV